MCAIVKKYYAGQRALPVQFLRVGIGELHLVNAAEEARDSLVRRRRPRCAGDEGALGPPLHLDLIRHADQRRPRYERAGPHRRDL